MVDLDLTDGGRLGYFWPVTDTVPNLEDDEPLRGWLRRTGRETLLDVLDEDPIARHGIDLPHFGGLVGVLQGGSVLLLEVRTTNASVAFGAQASWLRCSSRTVLEDVDVERLRSNRLRSLRADFLGIGYWAGMRSTNEDWDYDSDGLVKGFSLALTSDERLTVPLTKGLQLTLSSEWNVGGTDDRRVITAPVSVTCRATVPRPTWDLLRPLVQVQDLLNVAYQGSVLATSGAGVADLEPDKRPGTDGSVLWNSLLMTASPNARAAAPVKELPLFSLQAIGGLPGVRRWSNLATRHPRAVTPVVGPFRRGFATADVTVRDVAAAIEYWVKSNRPAAWAMPKQYAQVLARRLGTAFSTWVGDPERWAKEFWSANNHLKHEPGYEVEDQYLVDLAVSGRYVLLASLLNRVAGTRSPGKEIFENHRLSALGERLRIIYA